MRALEIGFEAHGFVPPKAVPGESLPIGRGKSMPKQPVVTSSCLCEI
jgi:hypothetical protein